MKCHMSQEINAELNAESLEALLRYYRMLLAIAPADDDARRVYEDRLLDQPEDLMPVLMDMEEELAKRGTAMTPAPDALEPIEHGLVSALAAAITDMPTLITSLQTVAVLPERTLGGLTELLEAHANGRHESIDSLDTGLRSMAQAYRDRMTAITDAGRAALRRLAAKVNDAESAAQASQGIKNSI
jgi:hypothetical protein